MRNTTTLLMAALAAATLPACKSRTSTAQVKEADAQDGGPSVDSLLAQAGGDVDALQTEADQAQTTPAAAAPPTVAGDAVPVVQANGGDQSKTDATPAPAISAGLSLADPQADDLARFIQALQALLDGGQAQDPARIRSLINNIQALQQLSGSLSQDQKDQIAALVRRGLDAINNGNLRCVRATGTDASAPFMVQRGDGRILGSKNLGNKAMTLVECNRAVRSRKNGIVCAKYGDGGADLIRISDGRALANNANGYGFADGLTDLCYGAVEDSVPDRVCAYAGTGNVYVYRISTNQRESSTFGADYAACQATLAGQTSSTPFRCVTVPGAKDTAPYTVGTADGTRLGTTNSLGEAMTMDDCQLAIATRRNGLLCVTYGAGRGGGTIIRLSDQGHLGGNSSGFSFVGGRTPRCNKGVLWSTTDQVCAYAGALNAFAYRISNNTATGPTFGDDFQRCLDSLWTP